MGRSPLASVAATGLEKVFMSRYSLTPLALALSLGISACGNTSDSSADSVPAEVVARACSLSTTSCLTDSAATVSAGDLTAANPEVTLRVAAAAYWPGESATCAGQYLVDIPPEKLNGTVLQIDAEWDSATPPQADGGATDCAAEHADVNVWGRASATSEWQLENYLSLRGQASDSGLCLPSVAARGEGEPPPLVDDTVPVWLTPSRYPGGLRVGMTAAVSCTPMPLSIVLAEQF